MPDLTEKAPAAAASSPLKFTRKVRLDRIGSATSPARLGPIAEISEDVAAEEGAIVVFRAHGERKVYGEIELP
ncbi:MAG TPA: hypothetical protein PKD58_05035, partial [Candidatus Sumerlaeota bacterium]|nr:hypothetical protein [Candidatus Sumerlaeota bacterium]